MVGNLKIQRRIVPEILELLEKRYTILNYIYYNQPIGRRTLSTYLEIGERVVRSEVNFLKKQNLIDITQAGMTITSEGKEILDELNNFVHEIKGLGDLEKSLKEKLNLKDIVIVPGDSDNNKVVLNEIGHAAALYFKDILKDKSIIALTGGTSVKSFVDNTPIINNIRNSLVIPARGGIGGEVELQANTLVATLAKKINANYKMLQLVDNLIYAHLNLLLNEHSIKEVVENIPKADILVYGIGRASTMANKRSMDQKTLEILKEREAVGEAFGCYFNIQGEIVYKTPTIGIKNEDTDKINNLMSIAGGKRKAKSILSVLRYKPNNILITDEGAAKEIINILKEDKNI